MEFPYRLVQNESGVKAETEKILRQKYSGLAGNQFQKDMSAVSTFISHSIAEQSNENIMKEAVRIIHRLFDFQFVGIALKDRDGLFRYKVQLGLTPEAERTYFDLAYSPSDLFDDSTFPSTRVSDLTRFYMSENSPYKEEEVGTYTRPTMLVQRRARSDEMLEGDYIDVYIQNWKKETIGYIELGSTRSKKMPQRNAIRWLELMAVLLGMFIS